MMRIGIHTFELLCVLKNQHEHKIMIQFSWSLRPECLYRAYLFVLSFKNENAYINKVREMQNVSMVFKSNFNYNHRVEHKKLV